MIHFVPESPDQAQPLPGPYAEAIARLASIRQALACVEQMSGEEPSHCPAEGTLAAAFPEASPAKKRLYEVKSERTASAAAAGLEAIAAVQDQGGTVHPQALERLKRELRSGLDGIDLLFSL